MTIEPDTKDWTWVLDRPCPECGVEAGALERFKVAALIRRNAAGWTEALRGEVRNRPRPDVWSPLEYACHVRDVLRLYSERLQLMLDHDNPLYPNWDQDATAVAENYQGQVPARVAVELEAAADVVAQQFADLRPDQWLRTGRRSDGASFTVESFARYFLHDILHHLHDVAGREPMAPRRR